MMKPTMTLSASGTMMKPTMTLSASGTTVNPSDSGALPATGTPTVLLIVLAALSAFVLLFVRKRA
jgi:LPXTG-motif cell wall-anchored protein